MDDERMLRPRRRGWLIAVASILGVLLVLVAAAAALGETLGRPAIERAVAERVAAVLPPGSADPEVRIAGGPLLLQLATGALERVELTVPGALLAGDRVRAHVTLQGVPLDREQPVRAASAEFELDEAVVNALAAEEVGSAITIGDGVLGATRELSVGGLHFGVAIAFRPEARGAQVAFVPVSIASVTQDGTGLQLDIERLVDLAGLAFDLCVAERLPAGVELTAVRAEPGVLTVSVTAAELRLDAASLAPSGAGCD